jgi:hypothetical protein
MATIAFTNNAISTLGGAITNVATSATLAPGTGVLFPTITPGTTYFKLTFIDAATGLLSEIVNVTNMNNAGDTIVAMTRGQEGTNALNWLANDLAQSLWTAGCAQAMIQAVTYQPARIITLSGVFVMSTSDDAIGLQRTTSIAASSTTLPSGSSVGQTYTIEDLVGNFQAYPVTVNAPAGQNISNLSAVVLNVNRQSATFRYYGSNEWSVDYGA